MAFELMQEHTVLCVGALLTPFFVSLSLLFPCFEIAATDVSQGPGESLLAQLLWEFAFC